MTMMAMMFLTPTSPLLPLRISCSSGAGKVNWCPTSDLDTWQFKGHGLSFGFGNGSFGIFWSLPSHLDPGEGGGVDPGGGTTRDEDLPVDQLNNAIKSDFGWLNYR